MKNRILDIICNSLIISLVLVLLSLLASSEFGRGFPLPCISGGTISGEALLADFGFYFVLVILARILARIASNRESDYTRQYKDANVIANSSSNVIINDSADFDQKVSVRSLPKSSSNKSKTLASPKTSAKSKRSDDSFYDNAPLLKNTNKNRTRNTNKNQASPKVGLVVALVAVISLIGSLVSMCDSLFEEDYDFGDDLYFEEEWSDSIETAAYDALVNYVIYEDSDYLSSLGDDTTDFYNYIDWNSVDSSDIDYIDQVVNYDDTVAVVKYMVYSNDDPIVVAVRIESEDLTQRNSSEYTITGIQASAGLASLMDSYDLDSDSYSEDEWNKMIVKVSVDNASAGDVTIDEMPILLWH